MRSLVLALSLAAAGGIAAAEPPAGRVPNAPAIISFNVVEALAAIGQQDLAGVFSFVPEDRSSMAMAAYLFQNRKSLKLFLRKVSKDRKELQAINVWDKEVLLYLVGMSSSPTASQGSEPLPGRLLKKIQELSLESALPLEIINQRRALRK